MESMIIAETTFQKQKMKGFWYGITPILVALQAMVKKN